MRCKNCGWSNDSGQVRCLKCNAPLFGEATPKVPVDDVDAGLKATLRDASVHVLPPERESRPTPAVPAVPVCGTCGYPLTPGMSACPACGAVDVSAGDGGRPQPVSQSQVMGTVNPWAKPRGQSSVTLKRLNWQDEDTVYAPVSFPGDEIVLNRANTDPNNNSITSRQQARISRSGDQWFIENLSSQQTTLLRVDRRMPLQDGDVIVLGNRMFEFRKGD